MDYFVAIFLFLVILVIWRRYHQRFEGLNYIYKVYELRDELRRYKIENNSSENDWIFNYYDKSFSITISQHYYITMFSLYFLSEKHDNSRDLNKLEKKINNECEKFPEIKLIRDKFVRATKDYLIEQHYVTTTYILKPIFTAIMGGSFLAAKFNKLINRVLLYPETSESNNLASC